MNEPRRLTTEELFRIGPQGLEDLSDDTIWERVDALFQAGDQQERV